jgi:hypothetical protein
LNVILSLKIVRTSEEFRRWDFWYLLLAVFGDQCLGDGLEVSCRVVVVSTDDCWPGWAETAVEAGHSDWNIHFQVENWRDIEHVLSVADGRKMF